ncbi:MAG TPA: sialidase family protein [Acidobacteriota bacterium]
MRSLRNYYSLFDLVILLAMSAEFGFGAKWQNLYLANWVVSAGLTSPDVRALAINPVNPATVYAAGASGVFKSSDGGASWRSSGVPLLYNTVALVIDSDNPDILYAAIAEPNFCSHSDRRLFKSIDGGTSWNNNISPNINGCDIIHSLVMDPSNPKTLYVANHDDLFGDTWSPLVKSTDGGAIWSYLLGPPFAALAIDPVNENTLYAGTFDSPYYGYDGPDYRNGVLKSADGGAHWSTTGLTNTGVNVVAIDPVNPGILYAATCSFRGYPRHPNVFRGLFKSTDSGASWLAINNGLADLINTGSNIAALVIDPDNPDMLYAGTSGSGVFKSIDGGTNWSSFNDGLTNLDIRALALALGNVNTPYAGTSGGVFKIIDNEPALSLESKEYCIGASWKLKVSNGAINSSVRLLGTSNGQSWEIAGWGKTDANGSFSVAGTFPEGTEGSYTLRVEIGGVLSNTVSFAVSMCKP